VRFRSLYLSDYQKHFDKETTEQFAAVTIHFNEKEMCFAFCGTDSTLVGWKEDLNMSFMICVPSQERALRYAADQMAKYPDRNVCMVGHSKGGNLACYAAAFLPDSNMERIKRVYSFDGPGFPETVIDSQEMQRIRDKVTVFMPQDSIVGRIMFHAKDPLIVQSDNDFIYQHDIYSWEVLGTGAVRAPEGATEMSTATGEVIRKVLSKTDPAQRKEVIDVVFDFLGSGDAHTVAELRASLSKNSGAYLKALRELPSEQVSEVTEVVGYFIEAYTSIFAKNTANQARTSAKDFWEQKVPEGARNAVTSALDWASPLLKKEKAEREEKREEKQKKAEEAFQNTNTEAAADGNPSDPILNSTVSEPGSDNMASDVAGAPGQEKDAADTSKAGDTVEETEAEAKKSISDLLERLKETVNRELAEREEKKEEDFTCKAKETKAKETKSGETRSKVAEDTVELPKGLSELVDRFKDAWNKERAERSAEDKVSDNTDTVFGNGTDSASDGEAEGENGSCL
jgi:hypothetical protein